MVIGAIVVFSIVTVIGLAAVGFIKTGQAWNELYGVDERGYR